MGGLKKLLGLAPDRVYRATAVLAVRCVLTQLCRLAARPVSEGLDLLIAQILRA